MTLPAARITLLGASERRGVWSVNLVAWFHDYCNGKAEIRFIRGRLKFGAAKNSAPFPSMLVIFREYALETVPLEACA